jgi:electron transport complex protein RnfA
MSVSLILQIAFGAIVINNLILSRMIGAYSAFYFSMSVAGAVGMGIIVTFTMGVATACTWLLQAMILTPLDLASLQLIVFIVIITIIVQLTELAFQKFFPKIHDLLGMNLASITIDCAILAAALITAQENSLNDRAFTFFEGCVSGVALGVGFAVVIIIMAGIREKLALVQGGKSLKELPQTLIIAGLVAMAFLGFSGMQGLGGGR